MSMEFTLNELQRRRVEDHLALVEQVLRRSIKTNETVDGMGHDDLYQEGCIALCRAAVSYKRYNADVFTGVNRRTAAVFQFHSAALRRLNKVGCQRYEGDYTRLKQKHAERRARRMAG